MCADMTIAHPDMTLFCGRGNGGVTPPVYERRRYGSFDLEGPSEQTLAKVGNSFRSYWLSNVAWHVGRGDLNATDFLVAQALAEFSDNKLKAVFPAQRTIGKAVGRSASTVNRSAARLRSLGLLEWGHRFLRPVDGMPRATTNMYAFRLSDEWAEEELPVRIIATNRAKGRARRHKNGRTTPKALTGIPSTVHAVARSAETYDAALDELRGLFDVPGYPDGRDLEKDLIAAWRQYRARRE